MGRPGGTADSLLKQTFQLSPRSGGVAGVTRQGWEIWSGRRRARPGTQSDPRGRHRRILSV